MTPLLADVVMNELRYAEAIAAFIAKGRNIVDKLSLSTQGTNQQIFSICTKLQPDQAVEFDPQERLLRLETELTLPVERRAGEDGIERLLSQHVQQAKISVTRVRDSYRVCLTQEIRV